MILGTEKKLARAVIDTNVIISALGFGGKPREILSLALEKKIQAITSPVLLAELQEVVAKKFPELRLEFKILKKIRKIFTIVHPKNIINILEDEDDNRVLEAAIEGECQYIVTGDKDLLMLISYQDIQILNPEKFLRIL